MRIGGAIATLQKGYLSDTGATPYSNKQMGAIPPSAILCISHWATKDELLQASNGSVRGIQGRANHDVHIVN